MSYKLVAIDMDGTLLNSKGTVSDRTRQAIYDASKKGVYVVLATGRILKSAINHSIKLNLNKPIISCNGAIMIDEDKNIIFDKPMKSKSVKEVIEIGQSENIYFHFYDDNSFYSNVYVEEVLNFYNTEESKKSGNEIKVNIFDNAEEILNKGINVYKFLFLDDDRDKLNRLKSRLKYIEDINICTSWGNNLEVMDSYVSKGNSLEYLCSHLNISSHEVIAIGDNENDISMIDFAGLGVAMGNGVEKVKSVADIVTSTNDEDGVAKVIEKYIL
ncbi:MAG: Cof-type HAD-IIB family hydrolase [Tissierellaceae bacterium]|nr:Cof-type HAD-IIB family hydrolase [Tissierellaceae bacterium]